MTYEDLERELQSFLEDYVDERRTEEDRNQAIGDVADAMNTVTFKALRGEFDHLIKKEPEYERD
jgi:hypothetical protein